MAPDFPYFAYLSDEVRWSHTSRGLFLFCLPAGLAVLWLFHAIVKRPLVSLAPEFIRSRISEESLAFRFGPTRRFLLILVSLLIGIFTHVLWDGFTHNHGYFVKHWPLLSTPVLTYRVMPLWRVLQQACSALGVGIVLVVAFWWWYRKPQVSEPIPAEMSSKLRAFIVAIAFLFACVVALRAGSSMYRHDWKPALVKTVIAAITVGCAEILLFALAWRASSSLRKKKMPPDGQVQLKVPAER